MPRIIPFIVVAVAVIVFEVAAGEFLGLFVDRPSPGRVFLLMAGVGAVMWALSAAAGRLADRWTPAFREHPDGLVLGEMRAIQENASAEP